MCAARSGTVVPKRIPHATSTTGGLSNFTGVLVGIGPFWFRSLGTGIQKISNLQPIESGQPDVKQVEFSAWAVRSLCLYRMAACDREHAPFVAACYGPCERIVSPRTGNTFAGFARQIQLLLRTAFAAIVSASRVGVWLRGCSCCTSRNDGDALKGEAGRGREVDSQAAPWSPYYQNLRSLDQTRVHRRSLDANCILDTGLI
jgi:hypothetical protein